MPIFDQAGSRIRNLQDMVIQLVAGAAVIILSIFIHVGFALAALGAMRRYLQKPIKKNKLSEIGSALVLVTIWLLGAHTAGVWLWSFAFLLLGIFDALEPAVYFALVAYTTLGFGDILLTEEWRILSGMTAVNGMLLFGFSAAFLFEVFRNVHATRVN